MDDTADTEREEEDEEESLQTDSRTGEDWEVSQHCSVSGAR